MTYSCDNTSRFCDATFFFGVGGINKVNSCDVQLIALGWLWWAEL